MGDGTAWTASGIVCGDVDIQQMTAKLTSARSMRIMDWQKIEDNIKLFLDGQRFLIETCDASIQELQGQIAQTDQTRVRYSSPVEIENLVAQAVSAQPNSFGSADAARVTKCGKPGIRYHGARPGRNSFDGSVSAMVELAKEYMSKNTATVAQGNFSSVCEVFLQFARTGSREVDDPASHCDELCSHFAKVVHEASYAKRAQATAYVSDLRHQVKKKREVLALLQLEQSQCVDAWTEIQTFQTQLLQQQEKIALQHAVMQDAEWAIFDAENSSKMAHEQLKPHAERIVKMFWYNAFDLRPHEKLMDVRKSLEAAVKIAVQQETGLRKLGDQMERVRLAHMAAYNVRERIYFLALKMQSYTAEAVRNPMRSVGVSEEANVYSTLFGQDVTKLPEASVVDEALVELHNYCNEAGLTVFARVREQLDLGPLCDLPLLDWMRSEVRSAVHVRSSLIVEQLRGVQTRLHPFADVGLHSSSTSTTNEKQAEPLDLSHAMSLLHDTRFYQEYLHHWEQPGQFLGLLARFGPLEQKLTDSLSLIQMQQDRLIPELEASKTGLEEAAQILNGSSADTDHERRARDARDLRLAAAQSQATLDDVRTKFEEAMKQSQARHHVLAGDLTL